MAVMKSLILLLLVAVSLEAQSLPEAARKERERQAHLKATVVFTGEKPSPATTSAAPATATEPAAAKPAESAKPAATAAASPNATAAKPSAKPEDRAKKYAEELARLKGRVVELQ